MTRDVKNTGNNLGTPGSSRGNPRERDDPSKEPRSIGQSSNSARTREQIDAHLRDKPGEVGRQMARDAEGDPVLAPRDAATSDAEREQRDHDEERRRAAENRAKGADQEALARESGHARGR